MSCTLFKNRFQLKLGGEPADDIERIKVCRNVMDPKVRVRFNSNNEFVVKPMIEFRMFWWVMPIQGGLDMR